MSPTSAHATVRQHLGARFHRLFLGQPLLIAVRRGVKLIQVEDVTLRAEAGEVAVVSAGGFADVTNTPDETGVYEAALVAFGADVVPPSLAATPGALRYGSFAASQGFLAALGAARDALDKAAELPAAVVAHRVAELLAWAGEHGLRPTAGNPDLLPIRVRALVARDPARDWRIGEVAAELGMSEPTLRRRLAAEGASATEIIADVRLSRALDQLQTSTTSITNIALDAGYDSPSRFAARFRARFGVSPGEIRGIRGKNDRIGMRIDRTGGARQAAE